MSDTTTIRRYTKFLLGQCCHNAIVSHAFHRVTHLLAPPSSLAPRWMLRLLRGVLMVSKRIAADGFALLTEAVQELRARHTPQLNLERDT